MSVAAPSLDHLLASTPLARAAGRPAAACERTRAGIGAPAGDGTTVLRLRGVPGHLLLRSAGRVQVQVGDAQAGGGEAARLLAAFWSGAAALGQQVAAVHLGDADAERWARRGCTVTRLGTGAAIATSRFTVGRAPADVRARLDRVRRAGVHVTSSHHDGGLRFAALDGAGRALGELVVAGDDDGAPGWRVLHAGVGAAAPSGTGDALVATAAAAARAAGVASLQLPPCPFNGIGQGQHPARARTVAALVEAAAWWRPERDRAPLGARLADRTWATYVALPRGCPARTAARVLATAAATGA